MAIGCVVTPETPCQDARGYGSHGPGPVQGGQWGRRKSFEPLGLRTLLPPHHTLSPFFIPSSACHRTSLGRSTRPQTAQEPRGKLPQVGAALPKPPGNPCPPCLTNWGCLHDVRAQERLALSPGSPALEPQALAIEGILVLRWASSRVGISRPAANRIPVSHVSQAEGVGLI